MRTLKRSSESSIEQSVAFLRMQNEFKSRKNVNQITR
jgi:hypothetical protein